METRQYGHDDIQFDTWYSDWMKRLAMAHSRDELEQMLAGTMSESKRASAAHLAAIKGSTSMHGNASRRANSRNVVAASGDTMIAIKGAIEIHELFPEHAKQSA
jgi:hypothetical protein